MDPRAPFLPRSPLSFVAALMFMAAPVRAQTQDVPIVDAPPPQTQPPVVKVEPPAEEPEPVQDAERAGASSEPGLGGDVAPAPPPAPPQAAPSRPAEGSDLPPVPSDAVGIDSLGSVPVPETEGPVAIVPNASGTPIIVQPPVIEPPEVVDEPWTIAQAIPWLIAGLLIGGSLAVLLVQRRRRRIVAYRLVEKNTADGENPPDLLTRKVRRPVAAAGQGGKPRL